MSHFPDPISLPKKIQLKRIDRNRQVIRSSWFGITIRLLIIMAEVLGFYFFISYSLLMDAIASLVDVLFSLILILCIKLAGRPPDQEHPFGHGRYEPLVGFQLGLFLVIVGAGMIFQQTFQLSGHNEVNVINKYVWIIPLGALILLEICYQALIYTAKKQNSPALAADALHYRIDGITSLFATVALGIAAYFPHWSLLIDHLGAISIGIIMIGLGFYAAKINLNQILDRVPDQQFFDWVRQAALRVQGVRETEKIRIQLYGPDAHVDIDIEVDPDLKVEAAHEISQKVRVEIQKEWPAVQDVTVHIEPYFPNDH